MFLHKHFAEIKTSKQVEECKALPERDYSQRKTAERIPAPIKRRQTDPGLQGDRRGAENNQGFEETFGSGGKLGLDEEEEQLCGDSAAVTSFFTPRPPSQAGRLRVV